MSQNHIKFYESNTRKLTLVQNEIRTVKITNKSVIGCGDRARKISAWLKRVLA